MHILKSIYLSCLLCTVASVQAQELPLFDVHLHYAAEDRGYFSADQVLQILEQNDIQSAVFSSTPNQGTRALADAAPQRIIPFLGVYRQLEEKRDWMHDPGVIDRLKVALDQYPYRGIGEFHLFAKDRYSAVLRELVQIATQRRLILHVHGDAEIVEEIFRQSPHIKVIWAHLGTQPHPIRLQRMLDRYPQHLYVDTSVRDERFLSHGRLQPHWREFFIHNSQRVLVGVDTFSVNRWQHFTEVADRIRLWLQQLPDPVARNIAYANAQRLFEPSPPTRNPNQ